ncbi:YdeI/OmpD-associated family protein [Verrucomicrobium spinosum]|uniref:YdeI/OmpD-associated family protein n=2 Tax=Verrucomicrobium spinosum TaxID=2736 RepID=UPI001583C549|nr:hypothetical protein [Verrucomicrobium spinosum]
MSLVAFSGTISTSLMKPKSKSADTSEWETWLAAHQADAGEVWLLIAKKSYRGPGLSISDALDVALCFGWIESHRKGYDETHLKS